MTEAAMASRPAATTTAAVTPSAAPTAASPTTTAAQAKTPAGATSPPAEGGDAMPKIDLGKGPIVVTEELRAYLGAKKHDTGPVFATLGNLAAGPIDLHLGKGGEQISTRETQRLKLTHPALGPLEGLGVVPQLAVDVKNGTVTGEATVKGMHEAKGLADEVTKHASALGWAGLDLTKKLPTSKIEGGTLLFTMPEVDFSLKGVVRGKLTFGLKGEEVTFNATGQVHIPKQKPADFGLHYDNGQLTGSGDVDVVLGKLSGKLHAAYGPEGTFEVRGTIGLQMEKYSGEVTIILADAATARKAAMAQLGEAVLQSEAESAKAEKSGGGEQPGASKAGGQMALVGWGTVHFAVTDWLTGNATVIVDDGGDVTLIGEIAPPAEVCLFEQRDYIKPLFKIEARAAYGIPVVGNIFLFANIGMEALAKLGPGKLHDIKLKGTYSTKAEVAKSFSIAGTFTISAFAGLRLRAEGGAGIEILDHDIKAGVGVNGLAGVKGYVSATPTIGMREVGDPQAGKKTEFYIRGHLEIAAQPFLGLSGDLFVELDSPWWSPAPDKKWTWPIGSLEYPLPGEFGIGADLDYVLGSDRLPEVKFGEVAFDSNKFITDLTNDHAPPKSKGEQEKPGGWKEGDTGAPAPGEGQGKVTAGGAAASEARTDPALSSARAAVEAKGKKESPGGARMSPETPIESKPLGPEQRLEYIAGKKAVGSLLDWAALHKTSLPELQERANKIQIDHRFRRILVAEDSDEWIVHAEYNPVDDQKGRKSQIDISDKGRPATDDRVANVRKKLSETWKLSNSAIDRIYAKSGSQDQTQGQILEEIHTAAQQHSPSSAEQSATIESKGAVPSPQFIAGHRLSLNGSISDGISALLYEDENGKYIEILEVHEVKSSQERKREFARVREPYDKASVSDKKEARDEVVADLAEEYSGKPWPEAKRLVLENHTDDEIDYLAKRKFESSEGLGQHGSVLERLSGATTLRVDNDLRTIKNFSRTKIGAIGVIPKGVSAGRTEQAVRGQGIKFSLLRADITAADVRALAVEVVESIRPVSKPDE